MAQFAKPNNTPPPAPRLVPEIRAIRKKIEDLLNTAADNGIRVGDAQYGVYAFFDYYGEPIYVGQTKEKLRTRVRRHLTNQRTDAVAMRVLDPLEVAEVELWPLNLEGKPVREVDEFLARAEYTVYDLVLRASELKAVLNEKKIPEREPIKLPKGYRANIVPHDVYEKQKHPDIRIARRAAWIADLARIITERDVSPGLRRTLLLQAKRLL
ncbi:MAG: GIY-YIG nuclease family protein [Candidatus Korobacteraceae bacterium]